MQYHGRLRDEHPAASRTLDVFQGVGLHVLKDVSRLVLRSPRSVEPIMIGSRVRTLFRFEGAMKNSLQISHILCMSTLCWMSSLEVSKSCSQVWQ